MKGEIVAHDRVALAAGVRQTAGLAAPSPPPAGALTPNEAGWLIASGSDQHRLHPRLWTWVMRAAAFSGMGPLWASLLGLYHVMLPATLALGPLPPLALFVGARLYTSRRFTRQLRAAADGPLAALSPGAFVRVRGVIAAQATVPSLFRGVPAVLFRNRIGAADETRGIDFALDTDGGRVKVGARDALLLDRPSRTREAPACGPVYCDPFVEQKGRLCSALFVPPPAWMRIFPSRRYESSVGPGDEVEVFGVLHHEADPDDAAGPFAREVPVSRRLRAGALPLVVRSVARG